MGLFRHPGGGHKRLKDPLTWLKVVTTLEKPPMPIWARYGVSFLSTDCGLGNTSVIVYLVAELAPINYAWSDTNITVASPEHHGISNHWQTLCSTACLNQQQRNLQSSALLALYEGNPSVTSGFPSQRVLNVASVFIMAYHDVIIQLLAADRSDSYLYTTSCRLICN